MIRRALPNKRSDPSRNLPCGKGHDLPRRKLLKKRRHAFRNQKRMLSIKADA